MGYENFIEESASKVLKESSDATINKIADLLSSLSQQASLLTNDNKYGFLYNDVREVQKKFWAANKNQK